MSTIFVVNGNNKAIVLWIAPKDLSAEKYILFRDTIENYAISESRKIAVFSSIPKGGFVDTPLVNNKEYYYTVVSEATINLQIYRSAPHTYANAKPMDYSNISFDEIKYSKHIGQIFKSGCAVSDCHVSDNGFQKSSNSLHSGVFSLKSWDDLMNKNPISSVVIPFKANKSQIIFYLNRDSLLMAVSKPFMPNDDLSLPKNQIELLMKWIDAGAKNDNDEIAFSEMPLKGRAFVTSQGEDLTTIIDLDKLQIARMITTGVENTLQQPPEAPHNVSVDWKNEFYYVNLISASKILKFKLSDNSKVGELKTGIISPAQVAITSTGDSALVTNFESQSKAITVIDTKSMTILKNINDPAMLKPHGVTITPDFQFALTANSFSDNLTLIKMSDLSIVATIPVSASVPALPVGFQFKFEPYQIVFSKDSKLAFVTCKKSGEVRVIDLVQQKVIDSIQVGSAPLIPAISPNGLFVYVPNRNSNSISIINVNERNVSSTIQNVGVQPHGIGISKDGKYAIVSCENLDLSQEPHHPTTGTKKIGIVSIIDLTTNQIIKQFEVGNFAAGVATTY